MGGHYSVCGWVADFRLQIEEGRLQISDCRLGEGWGATDWGLPRFTVGGREIPRSA